MSPEFADLMNHAYKETENVIAYWKDNWYYPKYKHCTNELIRKKGYIQFKKWEITPDTIAHLVNLLWKRDPLMFTWKANADRNDTWGNSIAQSPIWIRPPEVFEANIFKGTKYRQIIGHTHLLIYFGENKGIHTESWITDDHEIKEIVFTDCLQTKEESFVFEIEEN